MMNDISSWVSYRRYFIFNIFNLRVIYIFFNNIFFFTTSFNLLKTKGKGTNLPTSNLSALLFKLLKLVGTFFNLSISDLSTLNFKLTKSTLLANCDASTPVTFNVLFMAFSLYFFFNSKIFLICFLQLFFFLIFPNNFFDHQ